MMKSNIITSLAILKVNWDELRKDYLENFVLLIAECIRQGDTEVISVSTLQTDLKKRFGLFIPQHGIKAILRRVQKLQYIRKENNVYYRNKNELRGLDFKKTQQGVVEKHEKLIASLIRFTASRFDIKWTDTEAESALLGYIEENQIPILTIVYSGGTLPDQPHPSRGSKYILAAFVRWLLDEHASEFDYLETIIKGNMLANAIFLTESGTVDSRFIDTEIYFDTSFLIFALGYAGKVRQEPCRELLSLLYEAGADLRCFGHTADEILGVLHACSNKVDSGHFEPAYGPSVEHFLMTGQKGSDIIMLANRLPDNLKGLKVDIVDKPAYEKTKYQFVIDEGMLTQALESDIGYKNPMALQRDVDSIASIPRLRQGRDYYSIEKCKAIFVTQNSHLVRASRRYFKERENMSKTEVAYCITDYMLTNLLWLKKPLKAPDLPRKRLIADCYAATMPEQQQDQTLWKKYISEMGRLADEGKVTADDCYLLRYSLEAKTALMDLTLGDQDAFTSGTVPEILQIVRNQIAMRAEQERLQKQKDHVDETSALQTILRNDLEAEAVKRQQAEMFVSAAKAREDERRLSVQARAQRLAQVLSIAIMIALAIMISVATVTTFPWRLPEFRDSYARYSIAAVQFILLIWSILNILIGTTVRDVVRRLEIKLANSLFRLFWSLSE